MKKGPECCCAEGEGSGAEAGDGADSDDRLLVLWKAEVLARLDDGSGVDKEG